MKKRTNTSCPVVYSLDIWGDPWSLVIMRDILIDGKRYYRELLASSEGIATNILSARLQSLTEADLLIKVEGATNRSQTMYKPTQKALDLLPALLSIMQWGIKYNKNVDMSLPLMQEVAKSKDAVSRRLIKAATNEKVGAY